jgi:hypothetical protein
VVPKVPVLLAAAMPPAPAKDFNSVTDVITVKSDEGKPNSLVTVNVEPESNSQLAAIVIKDNGSYEFIELSYVGGKVTVAAKEGQKIQILQVKPGKQLDDFIPSYTSEFFLKYQVDIANGETEAYQSYIPEPIAVYDNWQDDFVLDLSNPYDAAFPRKLDQRNQLYITQSKGKSGFSWAASALAAVETLLGKTTGQVLDLIGLANDITGRSLTVYNPGSLGAGNFSMSLAYMSELGGYRTGMKAAKMANVKSYDAIAYNISGLKRAITDYGSVVSAISDDTTAKAYNAKTFAYYMSDGSVSPNNMIQIIGWDNEFSGSKFTVKPEINGAWIARDSRGASFGDGGYVYISYADKTLAQNLYVVTEAEVPDENEKMYSTLSTPSGAVNFNSKTVWSANTFEVDNKNEKLNSVAFFTANDDMSYEIWINDLGQMNAKKLLKTGKVDNAGYVTVDLDYPLSLRMSKFTLFVKMTTKEIAHMPIEKTSSNVSKTAGSKAGTQASGSAENLSYVSRDGSHWIDLAEKVLDANLCVRAWTIAK